jgi:hypothetical protein
MRHHRVPGAAVRKESGMVRWAMALGLAAASGTASAEWTRIGGDDESGVYVDAGSVKATADGRRAWVLYELSRPMADGTRSVRSLTEIDCDGERSRHLQGEFFERPKAAGALLRSFHSPTEWCHAAPDTIGMLVLQAVCSVPLAPPPQRITVGPGAPLLAGCPSR